MASVPSVRPAALPAAAHAARFGIELVIDFREVRFIDSTGLRLLVELSVVCGGRVEAEVSSPAVARTITLTGLDHVPQLRGLA